MRTSFLIPALVFYYAAEIVSTSSLQVGTVLFTTTDLVKKCWSESDKALLRARLIMQDVLPDPDCIDFSKPDAVLTLLNYFQSCYQIIVVSTYGKLQNLMLIALSDALGGYLRAYALPVTRKAYYSGRVKYGEAKKLFQLYDDIRIFLKTNGIGWAKPQKVCKDKFKPSPLVIASGESAAACAKLYVIEKKDGSLTCIGSINNNGRLLHNVFESKLSEDKNTESDGMLEQKQTIPEELTWLGKRADNSSCRSLGKGAKRRRNFPGRVRGDRSGRGNSSRRARNYLKDDFGDLWATTHKPKESLTVWNNKLIIPLPVLENCESVHTIAVPFRNQPLRNVHCRKSAFVLERYYTTVIKCLMGKSSSRNDIQNFNYLFHSWLLSHIYPHLEDEEWYPAFGGVLRITETIRKLGASRPLKEPESYDIGFMFSSGVEFDGQESKKIGRLVKARVRDVSLDDAAYKPQRYYVYAVLVLAFVGCCVLFTCLSYCCALMCRRQNGENPSYETVSEPKKREEMLNFHFIVNFFKRRRNQDNEEASKSSDSEETHKLKRRSEQMNFGGRVQMDEDQMKKVAVRETVDSKTDVAGHSGRGDAESNVRGTEIPKHSSFAPIWPYQATFIEVDKYGKTGKQTTVRDVRPVLETFREGRGDTIWLKPLLKLSEIGFHESKSRGLNSRFNRMLQRLHFKSRKHTKENKSYSSETCRCPTCTCTRKCRNLCIATSSSQADEESSAQPVKRYVRELTRLKVVGECGDQESSGNSDTERELSGSSESETTETTTR